MHHIPYFIGEPGHGVPPMRHKILARSACASQATVTSAESTTNISMVSRTMRLAFIFHSPFIGALVTSSQAQSS